MDEEKKILHELANQSGQFHSWGFMCVACEEMHSFDKRWTFDGNMEKPTFNPSLKVTHPNGSICHLFVRSGMIEYCSDSHHALRGQTVPMEAF